MSLRMVVSRSGAQISEFMMQEMKRKMVADPLGKSIFYIVPEQMTFGQEYTLFKDDAIKGSVRTQVVSFSRLAWRVLQETGGSTKQFISSTGTQMMLRKIIEQRTEPFIVFQKAADKHGFIQELNGMITEFKRHQITPELLAEHLQYTEQNVPLQKKLTDLHYIFDHLTRHLQNKYIDGEDQLQLLIEKVSNTDFLQEAEFYIEGFHRFTPQELAIIAELLTYGKRVTIALTADRTQLEKELDELDLFYQTTETYGTLRELARKLHIPLEDTIHLPLTQHRKREIEHLDTYFDMRPAPTYEGESKGAVIMAEAVHPRAELEGAIQEILRLVREEGYRYRDIAIFVRDTAQYYDLIQTMFRDYKVPVFIDEKRTMLNHPLIEFIRSLFDVFESNWRYDALFRLLKTGYVQPSDEKYPLTLDAIDELENYVLEYGIRNKKQWLQSEKWVYQRFKGFSEAAQTDREKRMEEKINTYRMQVVVALGQFDKEIRVCDTVRERCEVMYGLLERLRIPEQLDKARNTFDEVGKLEKAREEEQVWHGVIDVFDELVEIIGDEKMSFATFRKTFEAGLEALEFAHVPPSMDHIIVGSIDHSRIAAKKCTFLIGVNEGTWPMKPAVDGMINEQEREFLKQFGMRLAASNRRVLLDDYFYMYVAFTLATDYIWVSYALSDNEGNAKTASQLIPRLQELFPFLEEPILLTDPDDLKEAERFISTAEKTRGPLTVQLARYMRGYEMEPIWWNVLAWYMQHEGKEQTTYRVLQSLFYQNKPVTLKKGTVDKLLPKEIKSSVSRMEMLHRCSYQHFLQYGLQLEERRTYSLEAPDIGQLFHEALKTITEWVQQEGREFADLTKADSAQYAKKSITHLAPILQHHILSSSNRYQYIQRKLQQVIAQATFILSEQARASGFSPVGLEIGFGYQEGLKSIRIPLPDERELVLRGRIDRVDKAVHHENLFLRIIDYKSSERKIKLEEIYYGLALQMLTYLDVVLAQSLEWLGMKATPAGVLYFHVHDAMLSQNERLSEEKIADEIFKEYKMNGLVVANPDVAMLMDTSLASGYSNIIPIGLKRDGSFYSNSHIADEETFDLLRAHVHTLMEQAGIQLTKGIVALNPFENNTGNACRFCSFKAICQFDPILEENNYRRLKPLKDEDVIKRIRKEL